MGPSSGSSACPCARPSRQYSGRPSWPRPRLITPLAVLFVAKPTIGGALFLARPNRWAFLGAILFGGTAFLIQPRWIQDWLAAIAQLNAILAPTVPQRAPITFTAGPLVLLCLLRWRRPEARLVAALACVPQTLVLYEAVPLMLVPRTFWQSVGLVTMSYIGHMWVRLHLPPGYHEGLSYELVGHAMIWSSICRAPCWSCDEGTPVNCPRGSSGESRPGRRGCAVHQNPSDESWAPLPNSRPRSIVPVPDRIAAVPWRSRLALALAGGLLVAWATSREYRVNPGHHDFGQVWYASRAILHGENAYQLIGPGLSYDWPWPFLYPLTAAIVTLPFASLPEAWAATLFMLIGGAVFAWTLMEHGYAPLAGFCSGALLGAAAGGQWAPLLAGSMAVPWIGVLFAAKPTVAAAYFVARPSWWPIVGGLVLVAIAFAVQPTWVSDWRTPWSGQRMVGAFHALPRDRHCPGRRPRAAMSPPLATVGSATRGSARVRAADTHAIRDGTAFPCPSNGR